MIHFLIESAAFLLGAGVLVLTSYVKMTGRADEVPPSVFFPVLALSTLTVASAFV